MAILNSFLNDVSGLLREFERTQWTYQPNDEFVRDLGILTREQLRQMPIPQGMPTSKTTGSTGEQLVVAKTYADQVWHMATNIRELQWRNWDCKKTLAVINPKVQNKQLNDWGIPRELYPDQGPSFHHKIDSMDVLQAWIEEINPHYIFTYPSILKALDTTASTLSRFEDAKTTSENGGTMYSSEECGTIAITCPSNPAVYHVMENIFIETSPEGEAIISSMTNPWIRRYKIGDFLELGSCHCGRKLQTISKIYGRSRNMLVFPDGRRMWPTTGSVEFYSKFGIKRSQMVQTSLTNIDFYIISEQLGTEKICELIHFVQSHLGYKFDISIKYVNSFPFGKFEEFKVLID